MMLKYRTYQLKSSHTRPGNRGSSGSLVIMLRTGCHRVQTGSEAHSAFYRMGTGGKAAGA